MSIGSTCRAGVSLPPNVLVACPGATVGSYAETKGEIANERSRYRCDNNCGN